MRIAECEKRSNAFYKGEIAEKIDAFFRANGGYLRKEDFAAHQSEWVEPISTNYRGYDVCELPPNTQGVTTLEMLNVVEAGRMAARLGTRGRNADCGMRIAEWGSTA